MDTQLNLPTINPTEIIAYQDVPVVTTRMLADYYEVETHTIRQNFRNNQDRFIERKHHFKLEGDELKSFRNCVENFYSVAGPNTKSLILWTERGAARHAKMLNTDRAWEVFERLEDVYFDGYQRRREAEVPRLIRETRRALGSGRSKAERAIEMGRELLAVKQGLSHGEWLPWVASEFGRNARSARSFMNVAEHFKTAIIADLEILPTALYLLAQPSTPQAARDEAIRRAEAGEKIGVAEAKEIIRREKEGGSSC